jgi:hypothetical protein
MSPGDRLQSEIQRQTSQSSLESPKSDARQGEAKQTVIEWLLAGNCPGQSLWFLSGGGKIRQNCLGLKIRKKN